MERLFLWLSGRFAAPEVRPLVRRIASLCGTGPDHEVLIAVNHRFLNPLKLAQGKPALKLMLETIEQIASVSVEMGRTCGIVFVERFPQDVRGKTVFSHHTTNEMYPAEVLSENRVLHFKSGDLPGVLSMDADGFAGWSSIARKSVDELPLHDVPVEDAEQFFAMSSERIRASNVSKYAQSSASFDHPRAYVFVALQTVGDLVQKKAYVSMFDMVRSVVNVFRDTGTDVVIKRHPKCRSRKMAALLEELSAASHVHVVDASIHALVSGSQAVFTVNSGVGSEAMIYKKPIYAFGASDYGAIAHQVTSLDQLPDLVSPIRAKVSEDDLVRFYAYYRTCYQLSDMNHVAQRVRAVLTKE